MKQEPISCRADNALAARCQSFAARWACVLKRPIFYLAAYIDNNGIYFLSHAFAPIPALRDLKVPNRPCPDESR